MGAAGALLAGCSGGGGGGGGGSSAPIQVGFADAASAAGEGGLAQVAVLLSLTIPALEETLTVTVSDSGSGSGTSGADYTFADQLLSFPIGSVDGAVQLVAVTLTDDSLVEGDDETVRLVLGAPSSGKLEGSSHTLSIAEGDLATIGFLSAASSTVDESSATHVVTLELGLDPGDTLAVPVSATIADAGSGSATGGSDYMAFAPQVLTFDIGSSDGDTAQVSITVVPDGDAEGNETVVFTLGGASGGTTIGGDGTHVVTITEDDTGADGTLEVRVQGSAVSGGESFDLGSGVSLGSLGGSVTLELLNLGAAPIDLAVLELAGHTGDFQIEATESALPTVPEVGSFPMKGSAGTGSAGTGSAGTGSAGTGSAGTGSGGTGSAGTAADSGLQLDETDHAWLLAREHVVLHGVPLPGGGDTSVELARLPSPWRADARIDIDGVPLAGGVELLVGRTSLWRGSVVGEPGSRVFLAFSEHGSRGWIRPAQGAASEVMLVASAGSGSRAVWSATQAPVGGPQACGGVREVPGAPALDRTVSEAELALALASGSSSPGLAGMGMPGVSWAECSLALETDYQLYNKFGNVQGVTDYVTQLVAAVSDVYERDVQTRVTIGYLGLHTNVNDGWDTQESATGDAGDLLDEFRAAWGNTWPVEADLAHFLSGASLGGGIAYLDVLCNDIFGFGVSGSLHGGLDWDSFDGSTSGLNWDFVVVAHELGHNFGSSHTHDYCPPLDHCYANCDSDSSCPQGTLMSYCHTCGGMANIDLEFHPYAAQVMRDNVVGSCLGSSQLLPGSSASFELRFAPTSSAGNKAADLQITHAANNLPSPFSIDLTGNAID